MTGQNLDPRTELALEQKLDNAWEKGMGIIRVGAMGSVNACATVRVLIPKTQVFKTLFPLIWGKDKAETWAEVMEEAAGDNFT